MNRKKGLFAGIRRNVVTMGIASFLTDISSEMIYPILPLFLVNVLGAPKSVIGLIEGVAESTASLLKVFSGWLSDKLGKRKPLILFGYSLSDLSKPLLTFTTSWTQVFAIRFADRFGKGVRTAPRDALIADSTTKNLRGKAFGFHRALDTAGAATGPFLAFLILSVSHNNYRRVFLFSAIPGTLAILVLVFFLKEKAHKDHSVERPRITFASLSREFKIFTLVSTVFALGNSSDAFLLLRAQNLGIAVALVPIVYFLFNIVYTILAMPAGILSDRIGRKKVIIGGYLTFALIYLGFAIANRAIYVWPLFALYGVYYALTEAVQKAFVGDLAPSGLTGTAMGTYNTLIGIAMLPASLIGGALWQYFGAPATFFYGAGLAFLAAMLLLVSRIG